MKEAQSKDSPNHSGAVIIAQHVACQWFPEACHVDLTLTPVLAPVSTHCILLQFEYSGSSCWSASFQGNSVKGTQSGESRVKFASDGATITWSLPSIHIRGGWRMEFVCVWVGGWVGGGQLDHSHGEGVHVESVFMVEECSYVFEG